MKIWFTSDTHFMHENIIEHSDRPFRDLAHMHACLISNWNERIKPGDQVYHLGDFALSWGKKHAEPIDAILHQLHGQKFLITGNHDRDQVKKNPRWNIVTPYHEIKVDLGGEHKQRICLFHYSQRVWNQMHRGAWMLYGHSHGNLKQPPGRTMDVGVDPNNFYPVSLEEVREKLEDEPIHVYDHHRNPAGNYTEPLPTGSQANGDLYEVGPFIASCRDHGLIDYDGYGHPVKDLKIDRDIDVYPSRWRDIPDDATHVIWFNR